MFQYSLHQCSGKARLGSFSTPHGSFDTPNFMPVGTKATVKGVDCERVREIGAQVLLVNTYHLWQRPGHERIQALGGIHRFMNWDGPVLSDSGGYQVFSLESLRKISEDGVEFRSHIDGQKLLLTPEVAVGIQETLGVDIAMGLDECPPPGLSLEEMERSVDRTHRWLLRCLKARKREETALFAITQGGLFVEVRSRSAAFLSEHPFDGYAIGGLSVGEPIPDMYRVLSFHADQLPAEKVRYLMGVGTPKDLVAAVGEGIDLFDCVMPTRSGRFGRAFVSGEIPFRNLKNAQYQDDKDPIDLSCDCLCCRSYSRAYVHHLFRVEEMLGPQLVSIHNLRHYLSLMEQIREHIRSDRYEEFRRGILRIWDNFEAS